MLILLKKNIFHLISFQLRKRNSWGNIVTNLNTYNDFTVTLRGVRHQFTTIMGKYKSKARKEIAGTGLAGEELTENEQFLEDIIERYEQSKRRIEESLFDKKVQSQQDKRRICNKRPWKRSCN